FFSSRRRHTRSDRDWSSDVCSSDLEAQKSEWLRTHRDQFVVIKDQSLLGFFDNFHQAYTAGVAEYGMNIDFLVKRVVPQEPVFRSEERRVGKECRFRWSADREKRDQ